MNSPDKTSHGARLTTLSLALSSILVACGGGSDSPAPVPVVPPPVTLSGKVFINQAVQNALVCMDLNANNVCDAGEPTSAMTDATGAYSLTYDPTKITDAQVAAAPLIAQITPGTAAATGSVDAANPANSVSKTAYTLSTPAGKTAQINPLTTLVQTGLKSGLTLATAEAAVALQLAIPVADIYDYQGNAPVTTQVVDNARMMALMTASALANGAPLSVIDSAATTQPAPLGILDILRYTSASDFSIDTNVATGVAATSGPSKGQVVVTETAAGKLAGVPIAHDALYPQVYLTPTGWVRCDELSTQTVSLGTPNRLTYCSGGEISARYTIASDISGTSMATVVSAMQTATDFNSTVSVNNPTLLGTATFPAGSMLVKRTKLALSQSIYINNTNDTTSFYSGTLETFIAARPSSKANLANGNGMYGLGLIDDTHVLRMAFINTTSAVQFYSCDYAAATDTTSTCTASTVGSFAISTVNGVRLISYSGQPATYMSNVRGHAEYQGKVAITRQSKPGINSNINYRQSLNGPAFEALKALLPGL